MEERISALDYLNSLSNYRFHVGNCFPDNRLVKQFFINESIEFIKILKEIGLRYKIDDRRGSGFTIYIEINFNDVINLIKINNREDKLNSILKDEL